LSEKGLQKLFIVEVLVVVNTRNVEQFFDLTKLPHKHQAAYLSLSKRTTTQLPKCGEHFVLGNLAGLSGIKLLKLSPDGFFGLRLQRLGVIGYDTHTAFILAIIMSRKLMKSKSLFPVSLNMSLAFKAPAHPNRIKRPVNTSNTHPNHE
jgi:hypothetical protein